MTSLKEMKDNAITKAREIKENFTDFLRDHKKQIIGGVVAVAGGAVAIAVGKKAFDSKEAEDPYEEPEIEHDFGRDCTMKFIVDETGEELGSVKCTEEYANDMIDIANE